MVQEGRRAAILLTKGDEMSAVRRELLRSIVSPIRNVNIATGVNADSPGPVHLARTTSLTAESRDKVTGLRELLDLAR